MTTTKTNNKAIAIEFLTVDFVYKKKKLMQFSVFFSFSLFYIYVYIYILSFVVDVVEESTIVMCACYCIPKTFTSSAICRFAFRVIYLRGVIDRQSLKGMHCFKNFDRHVDI